MLPSKSTDQEIKTTIKQFIFLRSVFVNKYRILLLIIPVIYLYTCGRNYVTKILIP
jgi:predicted membrane protein